MSDFLFDRDFDLELESEGRVNPLTPEPVGMSPAEVAAVKAAAFEEGRAAGEEAGFKAGQEEMLSRIEALQTETLTALAPQITALSENLSALRRAREYDLARLCHALASRLLPEIEDRFGAKRIEAFARRAIRMSEGSREASIFVAPAVLDMIAKDLAPFLGQRTIHLIADEALDAGQARAEWESGRADYAIEPLHSEILASLDQIMQSSSN